MVQNAGQNGAKRNAKSINIHGNGITKPFRAVKYMTEKCKIVVKKWNFRG